MNKKKNNAFPNFIRQLFERITQKKRKNAANYIPMKKSEKNSELNVNRQLATHQKELKKDIDSHIHIPEVAVTAEASILTKNIDKTEDHQQSHTPLELMIEYNHPEDKLLSEMQKESINENDTIIIPEAENILELETDTEGYYNEDSYNKSGEEPSGNADEEDYLSADLAASSATEKEIKTEAVDKQYFHLLREIREVDAWSKLHNRLLREFQQVKLLSEIQVSDLEFQLLINDFRRQYKLLYNRANHELVSPIFAIELVQIAIRYYDVGYWSYLDSILGFSVPVSQRSWFGESFLKTLKVFGKPYYQENEFVANVLMHCFICNSYLDGFFDYLLQYYCLDLERDFSDSDNQIDFICDAILNPDSKRRQMLSNYSSLSMKADKEYCRGIVKKIMSLIDYSFWQYNSETEFVFDRYIMRFFDWKRRSDKLGIYIKEIPDRNVVDNRAKKHYTPYLVCDMRNFGFHIILPTQMLLKELMSVEEIYWIIGTSEKVKIETELKPSFSGVKTNEIRHSIPISDIFSSWEFSICCDGETIRSFKWKPSPVQFFNEKGDWIKGENLKIGTTFAFSEKSIVIEPEALIDTYMIESVSFYQLNLSKGDFVKINKGENYYIGNACHQGLTETGLLEGISFSNHQYTDIPVYKRLPGVILEVNNSNLNGIAVYINGMISKLSDNDFHFLSHGPITEYKYYYLDMNNLSNVKNGLNVLAIDIPKKGQKAYQFMYLADLDYGFEDTPYVFKSRGTFYINRCIKESSIVDEPSNYSHKDFPMSDLNNQYLEFSYQIDDNEYLAKFEVPILLYSHDRITWKFQKPDDIWHSEFISIVYFRFPAETISLAVEDTDQGKANIVIDCKKGLERDFKCDITKFKTYFMGEQIIKAIKIILNNEEYEIFRVITKSYLVHGRLEADYEKEMILGVFDIIGKGFYSADLKYQGTLLSEKVPIESGTSIFKIPIQTGDYQVEVFESDDEFGFEGLYNSVGSLSCELLNPTDLTNMMVLVETIYNHEERIKLTFHKSCHYRIVELQKLDSHQYRGKLLELFRDNLRSCAEVSFRILNLNSIESIVLNLIQENEEMDFLYDNHSQVIVENQDPNYSKSKAYRRYDVIDDRFTYQVEYQGIEKKYLEMAQIHNCTSKTKEKAYSETIWKKS